MGHFILQFINLKIIWLNQNKSFILSNRLIFAVSSPVFIHQIFY
jgi:hypothetical protein